MLKLSIIVCTYNRDQYIGRTLLHLANQSIEGINYEVLVIDNNSQDNTSRVCREFISENRLSNFHYFLEHNQGHTFARNRGIEESACDLMAFIDDDAFVCEDYVDQVIGFFESNSSVWAIGGKITPLYEGEEPRWMSKYLLPLVAAIDMGNDEKPFAGAKFPIGANMAFRRKVFEKHGTFDTNLGRRGEGLEGADEKELIWRLKRDKMKVYYVPKMAVNHIIPDRRLSMNYIKGLAHGVAKSELKRIKKDGGNAGINKFFDEALKVCGTFVLASFFYISFQFAKANMLIKFRYWVLSGYFNN